MRNILKYGIALPLAALVLTTGCMKETLPQGSSATVDQVSGAPGAFKNYVNAITGSITGSLAFPSYEQAWDFGYPSFLLINDVMGQDMALEDSDWYTTWAYSSTDLGPEYLVCQYPWTAYYGWINNCNLVINMAGENPSEEHKSGAGIAYAMRAMFYMDIARMFFDPAKPDLGTVPIVTEKTTATELTNNPRAPFDEMWAFILDDLQKAEALLKDFDRQGDYKLPDQSVVYGLKARAYLETKDWANAELYAKKAQTGYTPLTEAQYLDHATAFNTPNGAWIFGVGHKPDDDVIKVNDSDNNWASQMCLDLDFPGFYGNAYGSPKRIDAHLYETIPATDFRKKCFVDPAIAYMETLEEVNAALSVYTSKPENLLRAAEASTSKWLGHLAVKFRGNGGSTQTDPYTASVVSVPLMRVEEMMLIEAEAAGMQEESRGRALLEKFGKMRDPQYKLEDMISFQDQVWWQRRVELWGEGFGAYDIKRLKKGIIRNYAGTNHAAGYRWNTTSVPQWMTFCIVSTEGDNNFAIVNNAIPVAPEGDSPEHVW